MKSLILNNRMIMAVDYIRSLPGFQVTPTDANSLKITSVHFLGNLMYWPSTGSYRFSQEVDCKDVPQSGKSALSTLLKPYL